jgi:hypothetical protein
MKFEVASACVAAVMFTLHGCGGGGETTTGTTTTAAPAGPTTTTLNPNPPEPMDGDDVAKLMNSEYNGYDESNPNSPMGNWMRFTADEEHLYYCGMGCLDGKPDCKVSGSVMNYKMMIDQDGHPGGWFGYRNTGLTGFYVNSTLINTKLGKCAYSWDGGSDSKVNNGCGCSVVFNATDACTEGTKDYNASAYNNKVPPSYTETTNAESSVVADCACSVVQEDLLPKDGVGSRCYYKGPAFDTGRNDNPNEFHAMLKRRVENQAQGDAGYGPALTAWNELNIDGNRMNEALMADPAGTILAMIYSTEHGPDALSKLKIMNSNFQKKYKLSKPLPMIMLDTTVDVRNGTASPWVFKKEDQLADVTVV